MILLGIDVGTSGCKGVAFQEDGALLGVVQREYPFITPQSGWLEIDPKKIWEAVSLVIQEITVQLKKRIDVIAVTSHGETLVPLGKNGKPLGNAIANFDTRAQGYVDFWKARIDPFELFQITGMPLHGMYTVNKILWLREHWPEIFEETWKFSCVEDFVIACLTQDEPVIDYSLASRTMMFDVRKKEWSDKILALAGVEKERLPRLEPSGKIVGVLSASLRREWGLPEIPIATGGHDQPCGVLGCGIRKRGEAMYGIGTSECVALNLGSSPSLTREMMENSFCCYPHVAEGNYITLAYVASGGSVLRWFRDQFGYEETLRAKQESRDVYDVLLEDLPEQPTSLFVLPHFAGSGTPYLDERSRGAMLGLTLGTRKKEVVRAILESLTYEMKLNLDLFEQFGIPVRALRVIGGGSRSRQWLQIKADILQKPLMVLETGEAVALGTAMLAGKARGIFSTLDEAGEAMVRVGEEFVPSHLVSLYTRRYAVYREIYKKIRELNLEISKLV
ncbi:MAG: FGGY-family carbohydrate kinase [Atribacterota bacterium]